MEAWAFFRHAVRMVFGNFGDALRVTGVLYVAMSVAQWVLVGNLMADQAAMQQRIMEGTLSWGSFALYLLSISLASIWAVIGRHRYVLLEERPQFLPKFLAANITSYFWKTVLTTLIVLIPAMIAGGIAGALVGIIASFTGVSGAFFGAAIGSVAGMAVAILIAYRLSPMLPSAALGKTMGFGEAWAKLREKNKMLIMLAVISAVASLILSIPSFFMAPTSVGTQIVAFVIGWIQLTVGASIITTLYGRYVEGRELPR